jgi:hypothetical protein
MTKLYNYVSKPNNVHRDGLLSPILTPCNKLFHYSTTARANSTNKIDIINWLESIFPGRSKAISFLTEPMSPCCCFYSAFRKRDLYSFDFDLLYNHKLFGDIYCFEGDHIQKLNSPKEIDFSPLPWHILQKDNGIFFAAIRHYMVVLKEGKLPPEFLQKL